MCLFGRQETLEINLVFLIILMEYPLPGPVIALLQQEKASLAPKSYFISSGKKSIKITLVYAKGEQPACLNVPSGGEKKKSRHTPSTKPVSKQTTRRTRSKNLSESSTSTNAEQASGSLSHSESEQASIGADLETRDNNRGGRERMSTVDSGHPSSSCTATNERDVHSEWGSDGGDEGCNSISSSDSELPPRTPGRDIAVPPSRIGPGETPAARRDEMWQTWTRIPRAQVVSGRKYTPAPTPMVRRAQSPLPAAAQRTTTSTTTQRRPRQHDGASWDGSGNL